jgi:ferric-dicitrate binding protein FerR (iron transport regulator)
MREFSKDDIDPALLVRFLAGDANDSEKAHVTQWLEANPTNRRHFEEFSILWKASPASGEFNPDWLQADWKLVKDRIPERTSGQPLNLPNQRRVFVNLFRAAAVFACAAIAYFFLHETLFPQNQIVISSAEQVKVVTLPDGSALYLNAHSEVTFPKEFDDHIRQVILKGEAFFEVAKNKNVPFVIKTGVVQTEVVGTAFNVDADSGSVAVTVTSGKVLFYEQKANAIALTPGERGTYQGGNFEKEMNSDVNFLSWKTNVLTFNNSPMMQVVKDLNRHYGSAIRLAPGGLEGCLLTTTFDSQSLEDVLKELTVLFSLQAERSGTAIILKGNGCQLSK